MRKILPAFLLVLTLVFAHPALANTCAWVSGSTANWSSTAAWTGCGGVAPTAADDVTVSGTGTLTINGTSGSPNFARSVDFTGFTGTLTHAAGTQLNIGNISGGSLTIVSGMTYNPVGSAVFKFVSTTTGNHLKWGGKDIPSLTFDGVGGGWVFDDAPAGVSIAPIVTVTNGDVNFNSKNMTGGLSSNNSNTRSLTFGTMTWTFASNGTSQNIDLGTTTGLTFSGSNLTLAYTGTNATSSTINGGGLTFLAVTSTLATTGTLTLGNFTATNVTLSVSSATKSAASGYALNGDITVTGSFTANGNSTILRNFIYSSTTGTPHTITAATVSVSYTDFRDITGAGAGSWNLASITGNSGDCGGNAGITFTAPATSYWVVSGGTSSGSMSAVTRWANASNGTAGTGRAPLCQDTSIFDSHSIDAVSRTVTNDMPRVGTINWTGVTNTPNFTHSVNGLEYYGSFILANGMTQTIGNGQTLSGRGSFTFDGGGLTWPTSSPITVNCGAGTYTFGSNFATTGNSGITLTSGNIAEGGNTATFAGNISVQGGAWSGTGAVSTVSYSQSGGTFTQGGTLTLSGTYALSAGTFNNNGFGVTGHTTLTVSGSGVLNLSGQFNGSAGINVSGGTINDIGTAGELKGTTASFSGGASKMRKMTLSSAFSISSTANLTFNPGTFSWVSTWTETGTSFTETFNGRASKSAGVLTVTAAPVINPGMQGGLQ